MIKTSTLLFIVKTSFKFKTSLLLWVFVFSASLSYGRHFEVPEDSIVLAVNGKTYQPGALIIIPAQDTVRITIVPEGGMYAVCLDPKRYYTGDSITSVSMQQPTMTLMTDVNNNHHRIEMTKAEPSWSGTLAELLSPTTDPMQPKLTTPPLPGVYVLGVTFRSYWKTELIGTKGMTTQQYSYKDDADFRFVVKDKNGLWYKTDDLSVKGHTDEQAANNVSTLLKQSAYLSIYIDSGDNDSIKQYRDKFVEAVEEMSRYYKKLRKDNKKLQFEIIFHQLPPDKILQTIDMFQKTTDITAKFENAADENQKALAEIRKNSKFTAQQINDVISRYSDVYNSMINGSDKAISDILAKPLAIADNLLKPSQQLPAGDIENSGKHAEYLKSLEEYFSRTAALLVQLRDKMQEKIQRKKDVEKLRQELKKLIEKTPPFKLEE